MIHAKRFYLKVRNAGIGPGGWNCACCAPAPKNRPAYLRLVKKRERRMFADLIRKELENKAD